MAGTTEFDPFRDDARWGPLMARAGFPEDVIRRSRELSERGKHGTAVRQLNHREGMVRATTPRHVLLTLPALLTLGCQDQGPAAPPPQVGPVIVAATVGAPRATPLIGFNTNAHMPGANWTVPWFRDSTATLNSAVLRYPGGTSANHWDWRLGWFQLAPTSPAWTTTILPRPVVRFEEFLPGLQAAAAEAILVVNVQHSTLQYELEGLAHARHTGIPVRLVELGNEHNLNNEEGQFIPPDTYAARAKVWSDSIRAAFPGVRICAVGGNPPNLPGWHAAIFARAPAIDALAFHFYLGAANSDGVFNVTRALSVPFSASGGVLDRYTRAGFASPEIPPHIEVWVTEYNLSEALAGAPIRHADTWTHALYVSALSHLLLTIPRVTVVVNHNLTNRMDFAAIDPASQRITANGVAMTMLGEASKGSATAVQFQFPGAPDVQHGSTGYPSLVGWRFDTGAARSGWVVNLSSDGVSVDFDAAMGGAYTYTILSGAPTLRVDGRASLTRRNGAGAGPLPLPPYSIAVLRR
jgi:hypothetical protein